MTSLSFIGQLLIMFIVASFLLERSKVPQFKYVIFHLFTCFFTIYGYITNSQRDQLPVVLIAHNILKQCTRIAFCRGFFNLGSFLVTSNGNYYNLMPNAGVWNPINKTTLKKTLGGLGFTGSGKSLNEMLLELFWSKIISSLVSSPSTGILRTHNVTSSQLSW